MRNLNISSTFGTSPSLSLQAFFVICPQKKLNIRFCRYRQLGNVRFIFLVDQLLLLHFF